MNLNEALTLCPFRSIISSKWPPKVTHTFAAIGGEVFPMDPAILSELLDALHAGEAVLLISDDPEVRDRGKAGLIALAGVG